MTGGAEVHVVLAEDAEVIMERGRHEGAEGALPRGGLIVGLGVPSIVGDGEEAHLRGLNVLHGVRAEAAHQGGYVQAVAVGLTHQQVVDAIVRHGVVEPDVCLAPNLRVDPVHVGLVDHVHHGVARPHDTHRGMHALPQRGEVVASGPSFIILRGAHHQRCHVFMARHELLVQVVEQVGLLLGTCAFAPDVVEEDAEGPHADAVHRFKFMKNGEAVGALPAYVEAGMNGPNKLHMVGGGTSGEFADACSIVGRVGVSPVRAVVGVVLGTIDEDVHLLSPHELKETQALGMAVGVAIETLYHAAIGHGRPVANGATWHLACGLHGFERLAGIEQPIAVVSNQHDALRGGHDQIATGAVRDLLAILTYGLVALDALHDGGRRTDGAACAFPFVELRGGVGERLCAERKAERGEHGCEGVFEHSVVVFVRKVTQCGRKAQANRPRRPRFDALLRSDRAKVFHN